MTDRIDLICPDMLAGKRMLLIADINADISDIITCFIKAGCEAAVCYYSEVNGSYDLPDTVKVFFSDLSCDAGVDNMGKQVREQFGEPDILVIYTGNYSANPMNDINENRWMDNVELPLRVAYLSCRYFSAAMVDKGWGRIVLIGSVQAKTGGWNTGGDVGYSTLSMSLCGLARSVAVELAPSGITVNSVLPMLDIENIGHIRETVPLDVLPDSTDVAGAVLFLASERASFITGYSLDINCGLYMD